MPFLSVVLFIAMSITLFAGLTWTGRSMENRIDEAFDQGNTCDFTVMAALGLTDSDLSAIGELQGVADVEPAYISYESIRDDSAVTLGEEVYCAVRSITERINTIEVVEGTLPDEPDEIALLNNCTQYCNYRVGDTITFEADGDDASVNDGMKYLTGRTFTITALVGSADYLGKSLNSLGINTEGRQLTCVFYAAPGAFSADAFDNAHPVAYVTGEGLRAMSTFDPGYDEAASVIYASIKQAGETLAKERYAQVSQTASEKISDGQSQLDDAKTKISDAEAQISDGEQQLESKKAELADAEDELDSKIAEVYSEKSVVEAQLAQAESQLAEGRDQLSQLQQQYDEGAQQIVYYTNMAGSLQTLSNDIVARFNSLKAEALTHVSDPDVSTWLKEQCDSANATTAEQVAAFKEAYPSRPDELEPLLDGLMLSPTDREADQKAAENAVGLGVAAERIQSEAVPSGQEKLNTLQSAIDQMTAGIDEAQAELDANRAEYETQMALAESKIAYGESQIADGESQLAEGESELAEGKAQLAEKKSQYADGEATLDAAKAKAQKLSIAGWVVNDRDDSHVYQVVSTSTQTLGSLRLTMALLFMIVGLLVCYSVMSRLVHEHLAQLGTKKALGFTLFEIARLFLGYALLACIIGIFLGVAVGAPVVQLVLIPSMNQYVFDPPGVVFYPSDIVVVALVQVILICLSAWLACRSILKKNAVELLGGSRPSSAKRRFYEGWSSWERMGTLTQTMVNNCFNDGRRVFGTLVGVAGCTALIVCAVTLQGGIRATTLAQENVIEKYDQVIYVEKSGSSAKASSTNAAANTVDGIIASENFASLRAQYDMRSIDLSDGSETFVSLIVPENMDDLSQVMTLQLTQGDSASYQSGVYISSALANYYHYAVGDELSFNGTDGVARKVVIAGIFNYYGGTHVAIMSASTYRERFGVNPSYTARLVVSGDDDAAFLSAVRDATDFDGIVDTREITRVISETVNRLALTVVAIYIGISALVALFVLLNLNVMYISEKKRELIVMMINGYGVKDAKRYVSRDTIIMDVLGMVIGCALGSGMGVLAIHSLQNSRLVFIANVNIVAWVVGVLVCALFSFIVMRIALRRVNKFKLTSINE